MAVLTTKKRSRLRDSSFAVPETRKLPINDAAHVRAAVARFSQTAFASVADMKRAAHRIVRAAKRHKVELSPDTHVAKAAGAGISGQRTAKRRTNPSKPLKTAREGHELRAARRMAAQFHGDAGQVVELSPGERKPLPRYVTVVGRMADLTYLPERGSKRADSAWRHRAGDRGMLEAKSGNKPLVVANPVTGRPAIVMDRSPMRLTRAGLKG